MYRVPIAFLITLTLILHNIKTISHYTGFKCNNCDNKKLFLKYVTSPVIR